MKPEISVIIPTLNEATQLPGALESVRRALGGTAEIVVADGGSSDGTLDAVGAGVRAVSAPAGRGQQLNAGARCASGDTLLFLHADTQLDPRAGKSLAEALARSDVVGGCFKLTLHGPTAGRLIARLLCRAINARSRWLSTATGDQAIFVRRTTFERIGGFPAADLFEDVLLYRSLRRYGKVVLLDPPVLTSDRRWSRDGYLRTIAVHLTLRLLFQLGASPRQLARLYESRS